MHLHICMWLCMSYGGGVCVCGRGVYKLAEAHAVGISSLGGGKEGVKLP